MTKNGGLLESPLWKALEHRVGKFGSDKLKVLLTNNKMNNTTVVTLAFDFLVPIIDTSSMINDPIPSATVNFKHVRESFRYNVDNAYLAFSETLAVDYVAAELSAQVWNRFEKLGIKDSLFWALPFEQKAPQQDSISRQVDMMLGKIPGFDRAWKKTCAELFIDGRPLELLTERVPGNGPCRPSRGVKQMIIHLNDQHKLTREQIADWLDTLDMDLSFGGENDNDDTRSSN